MQITDLMHGNQTTSVPISDIFRKLKSEAQLKNPIKAFMTTKLIPTAPGLSPLQAAHLMVKHDIGLLPVIQDGQVIGIITRSDVMMYFYDLLPG